MRRTQRRQRRRMVRTRERAQSVSNTMAMISMIPIPRFYRSKERKGTHMKDWIKATSDRWIRRAMILVALAVAAFAAIQSYQHIYTLAIAGHEDKLSAQLLPLSVDGLILAASLNMLYSAVNGKDVHPLARLMLFSGIAATVAANVLFGLPYGYIAAATSAWPALAFVGTVEMLVILIRGVEPKAAKASKLTDAPKAVSKYVAAMGKIGDALGGLRNEPITVPAELTTASVSGTRGRMRAPTRPRGKSSALSSHTGQRKPRSKATLDQAAIRFAPDLEAGRVPSLRTIQVGMHVGQPKATELQRGLADSVARTVR